MTQRLRLILTLAGIVAIALAGLAFIRNLIDFPVYYAAGRSLLGGRDDLYAPDFARGPVMDYRYPPFFLLAFAPLSLLPYRAAAYLWYLLGVLQIAGCVAILRRAVPAARRLGWGWLLVFFAVAQYFVQILHYGNAHLLVIFLLFLALLLAWRGKEGPAALALALSITVKLTPILLLPYFALRRRWKFLALSFVFLITINLTPALYFGVGKNAELLKSWFSHVVVNQEFHEVNGPINLSLKGQLRRGLTDVDYRRRVDGDTRYPAVNVAALPTSWVDRAWQIASALLYLLPLGWLWRRGESGEDLATEFGLMVCLMLLVGPLSSKIYFIALLWPVVCLAGLAYGEGRAGAGVYRAVLWAVAITNCVLPLLPGRSIQRLLLALGADFYVNLLLLGALAYRRAARRAARSPDGAPRTPAPSPATASSPLRHRRS